MLFCAPAVCPAPGGHCTAGGGSFVIFGVDLVEAGLAGKVCDYFTALTAGTGAVRATLHKAVTEE